MLVDLVKRLTLGSMLLATTGWPTQAHDIYTALKDRFGESCCNDHDCRPARYRIIEGGVEMLVGDRWIVVPGDTIQYRTLEGDTGETVGGHWCGKSEYAVTYCAVLPPSSASSTSGDPRQTLSNPNTHSTHR